MFNPGTKQMTTTNKKHLSPQKEVGRFININILTIDNVSNILFFLTGDFWHTMFIQQEST